MWELPRHAILVSGTGEAKTPLNAFDMALLDAGIANYNHSGLSSILPAGIEMVLLENASMPIEGSILPGVTAECRGKKGDFLVANLALAFNEDPFLPGMIFELVTHNPKNVEDVREIAGMMVKKGMDARNWKTKSITVKTSQLQVKAFYGCALVSVIMLP